MIAMIRKAVIRGCIERISQKTGRPYLSITFLDEQHNFCQVIDWDMGHKEFFKTDVIADIFLNIQCTQRYTNISIADFKIVKE